jgi:hypothetical protein
MFHLASFDRLLFAFFRFWSTKFVSYQIVIRGTMVSLYISHTTTRWSWSWLLLISQSGSHRDHTIRKKTLRAPAWKPPQTNCHRAPHPHKRNPHGGYWWALGLLFRGGRAHPPSTPKWEKDEPPLADPARPDGPRVGEEIMIPEGAPSWRMVWRCWTPRVLCFLFTCKIERKERRRKYNKYLRLHPENCSTS